MWKKTIAVLIAALGLSACGGDGGPAVEVTPDTMEPGDAAADEGLEAVAVLRNRQGQEIGEATFRQEGDAVVMVIDARNLEGGERAIHIHEVGVCEPPDFQSAGGHFNPEDRAHGFDHPEGPHAGDLRNLVVDPDDGIGHATYRLETVSLRSGTPNSLLDGDGTAVVIHADADDYRSQPAGDAGDRIACGVISLR
jgi:superoxide dismutase, Cu-Zn family